MRPQAHRRTRLAAVVLTLLLAAAAAASAQDSLAAARQLYGDASYEEALAMLDRMLAAPANGGANEVEQYRALCLLALGRGEDAEKAIEAVVVSNASFQPDPVTTSPRIQAAFRDVRRKLLPGIVQQRYVSAKAAFDRKDYWSAVEQFDAVLSLIGTPDPTEGSQEAALSDMRTLIAGFRDLATSAMQLNTPAPAVAQAKVADVLPPPPEPRKAFYGPEDKEVVPPAAISQRMPPWTGMPLSMVPESKRRGAIELLVSEAGLVETATIRLATGTHYDRVVAEQAKHWKYSPATRKGTPVKYRKVIQFMIQ